MEKLSWRCMRIVKWKKNIIKREFSKSFNIKKNYNNNVNPLVNENIRQFSSTHVHSDIDPNSRQVIEKYKDFIKEKNIERKEKPQKKENNFPQNVVNKYKNVSNEGNNSIYSPDQSIKNDKNYDKTNDVNKIKDDNNSVVPNKDEKYIILKKQITKEFIHKVFLPHVESQIIYHIKTYTPDQIVNIFQIYSYLYYFDKKKEMVDQLLEYLKYRLDCFSVNNIVLVLEPLYILNKTNNIYIYRLIINYINKISDKFNLYNYIGISRVFTKILIDLYTQEHNTSNTKIVLENLLKYIKQSKYRKELPLDQNNISHKDFIIQFMDQVIDRINSQLHLLSAIELTDMLTVISNYSFKNDYSKYYIPKEFNKNNLGSTETHNDNENSLTMPIETHTLTQNNAYLFKENVMYFIIIKEMIKKYNELTTLHKITNLYSLSKLCIYDDEFIHLIEKDINNYHYINNIHHKYLALLVWCLFKFKILNKHIDKLKPIIQQNIFNFNAKGLSRLCHSISFEKEILYKIANNLINNIPNMTINEFLCYFYSVVYLDLLPFYDFPNEKNSEQDIKKKTHSNVYQSQINPDRKFDDKNKPGTNNIPNELQLLNRSDILQKCVDFINDNKKDLGKDEMTKIVLLLKKKDQGKYIYVLDMLPEEWKGILHLIN